MRYFVNRSKSALRALMWILGLYQPSRPLLSFVFILILPKIHSERQSLQIAFILSWWFNLTNASRYDSFHQMTATHQQAASGLDSDLSTPRTSLDLTIRCKGGIYAFKHIESLAICYDASKIIPENQGMLAIRAIYKSKRSWNPLELNVAIGRAVVPLEFLLGCPIGCAALEDRFMSDVGALGQTEIEDIATGWGLQEHAPYIAEASSDQSTILWGPRENAQVFHVADLRRTRAGEVLLDTVFQRTRQVGTIRSDAPISQIQHVSHNPLLLYAETANMRSTVAIHPTY